MRLAAQNQFPLAAKKADCVVHPRINELFAEPWIAKGGLVGVLSFCLSSQGVSLEFAVCDQGFLQTRSILDKIWKVGKLWP